MGGWLDQVGIRLTQLSTGLKVEAELGNTELEVYWQTSASSVEDNLPI